MFLIAQILMLVSLALTIHGLRSTIPPSLHTAKKSDILCYDSRYADRRPNAHDCASIIAHRIVPNPRVAKRPRQFSRRPTATMLPLPHTWESRECGVTIDIPGGNLETAEASLMDIKEGAMEVCARCVYDGDHLGGLVQVGRGNRLQVRVEAVDQRPQAI